MAERLKKKFNPGEAIIPGLTLAFGIAYFAQTRDASMVAMKWPYIIASLTGVLLLAVVALFLFKVDEEKPKSKDSDTSKAKILLMLVAPIIYIATMDYIGFGIGSFLFLAILFRILGSTSMVKNGLISISITAFLYISMIVLMKMSLPRLIIGSIQI